MADDAAQAGAVRIDIEVGTAQLQPGFNAATQTIKTFSNTAQAEFAKLDKAGQRQIETLNKRVNIAQLDRQQQLAMEIALKTEGALRDELTNKLAAQVGAARRLTDQNFRTQKQVEAALRGTPAQLTDIFVSLQGGQAPLTVLLQQGGQLKDMFGGITPAAKALGSTLMGLVNPATLATGAIAAIGVAAFQGAQEIEGFQKAIALSGNKIGVTVSGLASTAQDISSRTGQSVSSISGALSTLGQMGATTRDQLGDAASAALRFEKATGQAVEKTGEAFKSIQQGPVKAIEKLNEQYNFLTPNIYKQIRALEESGDKAGAARLATEQYTKALNKMSTDVQASAGLLERAWNGIAGAAKSAWDAMLGIGRAESPEQAMLKAIDRIQNAEVALGKLSQNTPSSSRDRAQRLLERELETQRGILKTATDRVDAENKSADAAAKNAKETAAVAEAMDKANKTAKDRKKALDELTDAYVLQADQVLGLKTLDEQALEATNARTKELEKQASAYRDLLDPSRKLRREIEEIQRLVSAGGLSAEEGAAAEIKKINEFYDKSKEKVEDLDMFSKRAARNIQDSFADFLFDPFDKGMKGMLDSFIKTIARMNAEAVSAQIMRKLLGDDVVSGKASLFDKLLRGMGGSSGGVAATGYDTGAVDLGMSLASYLGSFAVGIDNVPRDGFAKLHKGERVMTAAENKSYSSGGMAGGITYAPVISVDSRTDRAAIMADIEKATQQSSAQLVDRLQRTGRI